MTLDTIVLVLSLSICYGLLGVFAVAMYLTEPRPFNAEAATRFVIDKVQIEMCGEARR